MNDGSLYVQGNEVCKRKSIGQFGDKHKIIMYITDYTIIQ